MTHAEGQSEYYSTVLHRHNHSSAYYQSHATRRFDYHNAHSSVPWLHKKQEILQQFHKPHVHADSPRNSKHELPPFDSYPTNGLSAHTASPSKNGFAEAMLRKLGAPVTSENLRFLDAWQKAEGGSADNPFNTIQSAVGARSINHAGVKRYSSMEVGLQATLKAITNGFYGVIIEALRQGDSAQRTAQALSRTPWGTGALVAKILHIRR